MQYNLKDKVAIVTGASKGIGYHIANKLAGQGVKLLLISRGQEALTNLENQLKANGSDVFSIAMDVSDLTAFSDAVSQTVEKWGTIDILVNNAGITRDNIIIRLKEDDWDDVLNINLKGCFNGMKAVSRQMIKSRYGKIINISSVIGLIGNAGQSNYAASKAGILGLTKSLAKELGSRNITVNAIAPGYISTDMTENLETSVKHKLLESIPLQRLGDPDDIANMVCYLASSNADYITGQTFNVDGGMVMN